MMPKKVIVGFERDSRLDKMPTAITRKFEPEEPRQPGSLPIIISGSFSIGQSLNKELRFVPGRSWGCERKETPRVLVDTRRTVPTRP